MATSAEATRALVGRRKPDTWRTKLNRLWSDFNRGGVTFGMTGIKRPTDVETGRDKYLKFNLPWPAVAIIVPLLLFGLHEYNAARESDKAAAVQNATLSGKIDTLTEAVKGRNETITAMNATMLAAKEESAAAKDKSELAMDFVTEVRLVLASRGVQIKDVSKDRDKNKEQQQ